MTSPTTSSLSFAPLDSGLRRVLEESVVEARGVVDSGVGKVFSRLGVARSKISDRPPEHLADEERALRLVVLAKRRQTGSVEAAIEEVGFGVWHRMLFSRFLAENHLLIHPDLQVAVSLNECEELAVDEGVDGWTLASRFAAQMLPGLFPQKDLLAQIELLPEDLHALETLLEGLPTEVFTSDDGLGWVYQFWQSKRKDEVNASEVKIGTRELPAVTQLFTEHYMVRFLLENSLGAWWAARHPDSPLVEAFEYLRFTDDGQPAAGSFEGWPDTVAEVTVMDPCCGSGHFLTAAFEMLWRMRAEEEHLTPTEAQDAVIRGNLFGLELDPRCTQIAAFNLALTAWKAGGYRQLPIPNIACSGIRVAGSLDEWLKLAGDDPRLRAGLEALHSQFKDADTLGSLINPRRASEDGTLTSVDYDELEPLLHHALRKERTTDPAAAVFGSHAEAVAHVATLSSRQYTLVTTNPPFLGVGDMGHELRSFCEAGFPETKNDLATVFLDRARAMVHPAGGLAFVQPQGWLYAPRVVATRKHLIHHLSWCSIAWLGPGAFETISGEVVTVFLGLWSKISPDKDRGFNSIDVRRASDPVAKAQMLSGSGAATVVLNQLRQLENPDSRIVLADITADAYLGDVAESRYGLRTGDSERLIRYFWELPSVTAEWVQHQGTVKETVSYGGRQRVLRWDAGGGDLHSLAAAGIASIQGADAWGNHGVAVALTGVLRSTLYSGTCFDNNCAVIWPQDDRLMAAVWAYCSSPQFNEDVRAIDDSLKVMNATLLKVPFDVDYWRKAAKEEFPDGLPEPWSDDPTQWLFVGDPADATDSLQVAVARLLGYTWPGQEPDDFGGQADADGLVCMPAVSGERPAADRLRELLVSAVGTDDPTGLIEGLLAEVDADGRSLDWWLRERFFKQHCKLFHNRPFIWHVWDGRKDGFSALVNYHKLDNANLKKLTYSYLGWWIDRQKGQVREEKPGAEARLAAALELQRKLELILEGEPPFDIFVRWKELHEQPIGWEPDLNDGVRLNVRPFVEAGILRTKFNVHWKKDRGKNPDGSVRLNTLSDPYTRADKLAARQAHEEQQ